jgi:hypothetical protein
MMNLATKTALTSRQCDDLRAIAAMMIPPSAEYDVPGADDAAIQADILATLGRDTGAVQAALDRLAGLAGGPLSGLDAARREAVVNDLRTAGGPALATLSRVILQCYYRDDRVLKSLNLELRAPFPKGYALEQGDWSLLEPIRARPSTWRRAP